jgi:hypothetical protein
MYTPADIGSVRQPGKCPIKRRKAISESRVVHINAKFLLTTLESPIFFIDTCVQLA